jgi:hypothetical protein
MIVPLDPLAADEEYVAKTQATQSEHKCDGQPYPGIHGSSLRRVMVLRRSKLRSKGVGLAPQCPVLLAMRVRILTERAINSIRYASMHCASAHNQPGVHCGR